MYYFLIPILITKSATTHSFIAKERKWGFFSLIVSFFDVNRYAQITNRRKKGEWDRQSVITTGKRYFPFWIPKIYIIFDQKKGSYKCIYFYWYSVGNISKCNQVATLLNIFQPCVSKDSSRHGNNSITYKKSIAHQSFYFLVELLEQLIFSAKTDPSDL